MVIWIYTIKPFFLINGINLGRYINYSACSTFNFDKSIGLKDWTLL